MAHKNYILDTSTLVHNSNCIKVFKDNNVIIPIAVLEELDHLKVRPDSVGKNARIVIRKIDEYCKDKDITRGIDIGDDIMLSIDVLHTKDIKFDAGNKDDSILACAAAYKDAILVSKDINMRIRAQAFGIKAQDYENDKIDNIEELYCGYKEFNLDVIGAVDCLTAAGVENVENTIFSSLYPNECVQITSNGVNSIFRRKGNRLVPIRLPADGAWGLKSRNREQAFAMDLLLDPEVPLVTLIGLAGSGKTLISVAAALELCINAKKYNKVEIYRPIQPVGNDLGYLPGELNSKLEPWMGSIYDSLEFLMGGDYKKTLFQYQEKIKLEAITYIRGKSINNSIMIVDECQNISKNDVKTILTRVGFNTKIILVGDIEQIDSSYLDSANNGLTHAIELFKNSNLSGHVTLRRGERSELATEASKIM